MHITAVWTRAAASPKPHLSVGKGGLVLSCQRDVKRAPSMAAPSNSCLHTQKTAADLCRPKEAG